MRISKRALEIPEEPFFIALNLPPGVLRLTAGEPDFASAPFVNEAAVRAISDLQTHYTPPAGIMPLREAIAKKLKRENGITYEPKEVVVTPGSSGAVGLALIGMIDPGDEVLLPDPAWFHYETLVRLSGGFPKRVLLDRKDGFLVHGQQFEEAATKRTKAIILNSPSNPSGRVFSKAELEEIAGVAERLDLTVLSDEIYEKIVYQPNHHVSMGSLPGMRERTVTINGFAKGYAMMGWRVGYVAAPFEMIRKLDPILGYTLVCAGSVAQYAALEAVSNPKSDEYVKNMLAVWSRRRQTIMKYVSENSEVISARPPEGTFYGWLDVSGSGVDGKEASRQLLDAKVGVMPGYLFGNAGRNHVRISFATNDSVVEEGMKKICEVLTNIRKRIPTLVVGRSGSS